MVGSSRKLNSLNNGMPLCGESNPRFHAVCKNWSVQPAHLVKAKDKLPWMMEYKWRPNSRSWSNYESFCKIYEPLHHDRKLPHVVEVS